MKNKILTILIAIFLISGCTQNSQTQNNFVSSQNQSIIEKTPPIIEEVIKIPDPQVTSLLFAGDNLIHSRVYRNAQTEDGYDFTSTYQHVAQYFRDADIAMINQETVINDLYPPATYPRFSTPLEMADTLIDMGIDLITVANNHVFDVNEDGLVSSLEYFRDNTNILTIGAYLSQEEYENIRIIERNDTIFSFIGATQSTNGLSIKSSSEVVLLKTQDEELFTRIKKAKEISDIVIVNVHWGDEYNTTPNSYQTQLAQQIADAGADIIIGHHPHVLQPIEYLEGIDGNQTLVVYSLGNFMSTQDEKPRVIGGLINVEITKTYIDEDNYILDISNCELMPIITYYNTSVRDNTVYPLFMYTEEISKTHGLYNNGSFSLDYINNFIEKVIDEKYLAK